MKFKYLVFDRFIFPDFSFQIECVFFTILLDSIAHKKSYHLFRYYNFELEIYNHATQHFIKNNYLGSINNINFDHQQFQNPLNYF